MPTDVITDNTTVQNAAYDTAYTGVAAVGMRENAPTTNYQEGKSRLAGNTSGYARRLLYAPTGISNISGPVTVSSATLYLYVYSQGDTTDATLTFHQILRNWVQAQATWNDYATSTAWTTAGASGSGTDIASSAIGTISTGTSAAPYWVSLTGAGLASLCEDWINNGGIYGARIISDIDPHKEVVTGIAGYDGSRPELFITWAAAGGGDPEGRLIGGKLIRGGLLRSGVL